MARPIDATEYITRVTRAEADRLALLQSLENTLVQLGAATTPLTRSMRQMVDVLRQEQRQYEALTDGASDAIAETQKLIQAEGRRIAKISQMRQEYTRLAMVDQRAASAIRDRIKNLMLEQEQYAAGSKGAAAAVAATKGLIQAESDRIDQIIELQSQQKQYQTANVAVAWAISQHIAALMLEQKQFEAGSKGAAAAVGFTQGLMDKEQSRLEQMAELQNQATQLRGVDQRAVQSIRERMKALREEQRHYETTGFTFLQKFFSNMQASVQEAGIRIGQRFADAADSVRAAGPSVRAAGGALAGMASAAYERMGPTETDRQFNAQVIGFFGQMRTNATDFWSYMTGAGQEYEAEEKRKEKARQDAQMHAHIAAAILGEDEPEEEEGPKPRERSRAAKVGNWLREGPVGRMAGYVGNKVSEGAGVVGNMASSVASATAPIASAIGPVVSALSSSLGVVTAVAAPLATGLGAVAAAAIAPAAAFMAVTAAAVHFTEVLNPGLIKQFNLVMRDLSAVIGVALMPIVESAVPIMRSFADMLFPLARQFSGILTQIMVALEPLAQAYIATAGVLFDALMPVFQLLADAIAQTAPVMVVLQGVLQMVISALKPVLELIISLLMPIIQVVAVIMQVLAAALQAVIAPVAVVVQILAKLLQVVVDVIMVGLQPILDVLGGLARMAMIVSSAMQTVAAGLMAFIDSIFKALGLGDIGKDFKGIIDRVVAGFQKFVNNLILAAAIVAKIFGATSFIAGMIQNLQGGKKEDSTGLAAAQNPAYKSIEALGKDMALQASIATGGEGKKETIDTMTAKMVESLQAIQNGEGSNAMVEAIHALPGQIAAALAKKVGFEGKDTVDAAANMSRSWMPSWITDTGDWLGDQASKVIYG